MRTTTLDAVARTVSIDIIQPYTYTQKKSTLARLFSFSFVSPISPGRKWSVTVPILRDVHQTFTLLENVKPEDTRRGESAGHAFQMKFSSSPMLRLMQETN